MTRIWLHIVVLVVSALAGFGCANSAPRASTSPMAGAVEASPDTTPSKSFEGVWQSCAGAEFPEQCNRYVLLQRGMTICGKWSYFASGDVYDGQIMAEAISRLQARRTRICGRPGSEAGTRCELGWEVINRPLRICDGKLGDMNGPSGKCFADFERVENAEASLAVLAREPWVQACLARTSP